MTKKFEAGQRVIRQDSLKMYEEYEDDQAIRGTIKSLAESDQATVKWDSTWMSPNPQTLSTSKLVTEEEGDAKLSALEAEYNLWADPIKAKLVEAGKLLKEADEMATKQKRELHEMHNLTAPLIHAMDSIGWSTSSLSC